MYKYIIEFSNNDSHIVESKYDNPDKALGDVLARRWLKLDGCIYNVMAIVKIASVEADASIAQPEAT